MRRSISSLLILLLLLMSTVSLAASSPELVVAVEPYVAHLTLKQSLSGMRVTMEALARAFFQNRVGP